MRYLIASAVLLLSVGAARAVPITYTDTSAVVRVTIAGGAPQLGSLTLSETANTSTIVTISPGNFANPGTVTFTFTPQLGGTPTTGTFTDSMQVGVNQGIPAAGFVDTTLSFNVLATDGNAALASYALTTSLPATSGSALDSLGTAFPTSVGTLVLDSIPQDIPTTTFSATTTSEPGSLSILALGLVGVGAMRRPRRG